MKTLYNNLQKNGVSLIIALMLANMLNLFLNILLGRVLSLEAFGLFIFITALYYLINIILLALITTTNHHIAVLNTHSIEEGILFYHTHVKKLFFTSILVSLFWILFSPLLNSFFHLGSIFPVLLFTPILFFGPILSLNKGYLQASFSFFSTGMIILSEVIAKVLLIFFFLTAHLPSISYIAIPFAVCISYLFSHRYTSAIHPTGKQTHHPFPKQFFLATIITGVASSAFLSLDVVIVKHFLSPVLSGEYALLSLVGKMIYFFGTLCNGLMVSFVSRDEGLHIPLQKTFRKFLLITILLTLFAFIILGPFGKLLVPFVFGTKTSTIIPYLLPYAVGIACFTITSTLISYHLLRHHYRFVFAALLIPVCMLGGILLFHGSIGQIVSLIASINIASLLLIFFLHVHQSLMQSIRRRFAWSL